LTINADLGYVQVGEFKVKTYTSRQIYAGSRLKSICLQAKFYGYIMDRGSKVAGLSRFSLEKNQV
jgi:hypothetical protein